jgi:hypothetical protein
MNGSDPAHDPLVHASQEEITSALFANMVLQQTNMAMIFLGKTPHPETGERIRDAQTARMFIDQLEMLEIKTKGNLDKREEGLLKQSLTAVRMAFVEAVDQEMAQPSAGKETAASASAPPSAGEPAKAPLAADTSAAGESDSRRKFSKKY